MVDPLDGAEGFADHTGPFTVNIALIEGSRPVWGVVYDPLDDTAYYAKGASGSYRASCGGEPEPLGKSDSRTDRETPVVLSAGNGLPEAVRSELDKRLGDYRVVNARSALALCQLAAGEAEKRRLSGAVGPDDAGPTVRQAELQFGEQAARSGLVPERSAVKRERSQDASL